MASSTKRVALVNSARKLPKGAKLVGAADPKQEIEISVRLRARRADDEQVMALGAQPPREREYLSRAEFAAQMGADTADVAKIDDFAHHHELNVKSVHLASRTVKLTGTVKAMCAAFGVKLNKVKHDGATYRMRKGNVQIPAELEGIVVGVHGLDNRPVAQPHFRPKLPARLPARREKGATARAAQGGSFSVEQIAQLYNFPGGETGAGQCIAIIELNDIDQKGHPTGAGYKTSDLKTFFKKAGIPMPKIVPASVDGGANRPGHSEADGEVVLDIEVAGAIAPGARIVVYFAPNTTNGFIDAVKAAVHDTARKPSVISISWGGPEDPAGSQQFVDGLNEAIRDAAAMGVTVCVASGDNGSADMADGWDGKPHADFPASSPFALACGGTNLTGVERHHHRNGVERRPAGWRGRWWRQHRIPQAAIPGPRARAEIAVAFGRARRARRVRRCGSCDRLPDLPQRRHDDDRRHQCGGAADGRIDRAHQRGHDQEIRQDGRLHQPADLRLACARRVPRHHARQ